MRLGSKKIPVKQVEDFSGLSKDQFWKKMEAQNYAHLYDLTGSKVSPPSHFNELVDDPNRYYALLM